MEGNFERRLCKTCDLHVHNFSEMSEASKKALLESDKLICVIYYTDFEGKPFSFNDLPWHQRISRRLRVYLGESLISLLTSLFLFLRRHKKSK